MVRLFFEGGGGVDVDAARRYLRPFDEHGRMSKFVAIGEVRGELEVGAEVSVIYYGHEGPFAPTKFDVRTIKAIEGPLPLEGL